VRHVVVIGAGVVGVACAHYLRRAGVAVTLLDRGTVGGGCSHANCGYVCPSHVLPLAGPGVIAQTIPLLFRRDSPLRIRWRLDPALWSWLGRFALRCNRRDMLASASGISALLNSSRSLYDHLFDVEGLSAEWEKRGLLFVFRSPSTFDHYAPTDDLLRTRFAMPARRYDARQLADLEPALLPGLPGAYHYELDAHLRPDRLLSSWRDLLLSRGVQIREGCELTGFDREGRRLRAVRTSQGDIPADAAVIAAGAWTPLLAKHTRCPVPIQPGKGYSITMPRPSLCPRIPMIFEEDRVAVTPMQSGYRIGSMMEFSGYDAALDPRRLGLLRDTAKRYLREPLAEPVQEEWTGFRPMTPDGKPIIDFSPGLDNVLVAAGHGMLGLSMAPATGKLVAERLGGEATHIDPAPYRLSRFL
jgi:D-amino-acid dehydrogenase